MTKSEVKLRVLDASIVIAQRDATKKAKDFLSEIVNTYNKLMELIDRKSRK